MLKFLVIDDTDRELIRIKEYILNFFPDSKVVLSHVPRGSGSTVKEVSDVEQKKRVLKELNDHWNDVDVVLIDMVLLGPSEEKLVSKKAIETFLNNKIKLQQLEDLSKCIIIISSMLEGNYELILSSNIKDYIPIVNKPPKRTKNIHILKSLCRSCRFCDQFKINSKECEKNMCLKNTIESFLSRREAL